LLGVLLIISEFDVFTTYASRVDFSKTRQKELQIPSFITLVEHSDALIEFYGKAEKWLTF
jgi:hypothetical protein